MRGRSPAPRRRRSRRARSGQPPKRPVLRPRRHLRGTGPSPAFAASVAECVQPAPCVAATSCRSTSISTCRSPSKRWSTASSPWPPVTITAGAPSSWIRSASSRLVPVPASASASIRFGVTTVASGNSRSTSASTASSWSSFAPELATITGSTTSGTRCTAEEVGDGVDQLAREEHARLRRVDADVGEDRLELRLDERRRAAPARRSRRACSVRSARRSRSSRSNRRPRTPSGRPGSPLRLRSRSPQSSRHLGTLNSLPSPA